MTAKSALLFICLRVGGVMALWLWQTFHRFGEIGFQALFNVTSIITGTGCIAQITCNGSVRGLYSSLSVLIGGCMVDRL
jgi:hypothetical protein